MRILLVLVFLVYSVDGQSAIRTELVQRVATEIEPCLEVLGAKKASPGLTLQMFRLLVESDGLFGPQHSLTEEEAISVSRLLVRSGFPLNDFAADLAIKPFVVPVSTSLDLSDKKALAVNDLVKISPIAADKNGREKLARDLERELDRQIIDWDAFTRFGGAMMAQEFGIVPQKKSAPVVVGEQSIELHAPGSLGDMLGLISQSRVGNALVEKFREQEAIGGPGVAAQSSPEDPRWGYLSMRHVHNYRAAFGEAHADFRYDSDSGKPAVLVNFDSDVADALMPLVHSLYRAIDEANRGWVPSVGAFSDDEPFRPSKPHPEPKAAQRLVYEELVEQFPQAIILADSLERPHSERELPVQPRSNQDVIEERVEACGIVLAKLGLNTDGR